MELKEQIIKALECCTSEKYICEQCPIDEKIKDDCECGKVVARNALSLIKELTEENERLRELGTTKEVEKEIVRRETRADTVRKMQTEIEARCRKGGIYPAFVKSTIDQIAKEMLEDL